MLNSRSGWRAIILLSVSSLIIWSLFISYRRYAISDHNNSWEWRPGFRFSEQTQTPAQPSATVYSPPVQPQNNSAHDEPAVDAPSFEPGSFDIVVSHYDEDLTALAIHIEKFKAVQQTEQYRETKVFVYTKNRKANLADISNTLNTSLVYLLPNRGRESGTFLTHIIESWEELGSHTMFIQGAMHYPDQVLRKIEDWLVAPSEGKSSSGVLTLGYYAECQCTSCHDAWDQSIIWTRIAELYSLLNGELCQRDILLTYLGQILVSRKRITSRGLETYKYLKEVLESDMDHDIHSDPQQENVFGDSLDNPYFGHALERAWMVIWGCNNRTMVDTCGSSEASVHNSRGEGVPVDACQCMDD